MQRIILDKMHRFQFQFQFGLWQLAPVNKADP
jgi:hypothetical protein